MRLMVRVRGTVRVRGRLKGYVQRVFPRVFLGRGWEGGGYHRSDDEMFGSGGTRGLMTRCLGHNKVGILRQQCTST